MASQRLAIWNAEEDLEEDVDINLALDAYGQEMQYDDCMWT